VARETQEPASPKGISWGPLDSVALALITLVGGILRLFRVADPHQFVFDEVYYAKDACTYVKSSLEACGLDTGQNEVHPPLGKWLIAGGIKLFGFDSLGYRIGVVLAGTLAIALLFLLARKILGSLLGASLAAGLLAIDPLHFVQSRTSMLDIFVPLFAVAALLFVVYDRARLLKAVASGSLGGPRLGILGRPWRLAAGIAAGAAFASKWSGAFVIVAVIALTITWEISARRPRGWIRAVFDTIKEEGPTIVLSCVVAPLLFYVATFAAVSDSTGWNDQNDPSKKNPRELGGPVLTAPWTNDSWWESVWAENSFNWKFHRELESTHPYQSEPWSWILLKRPVTYFYQEADPEGNVREVLAIGSPFVWWSSILALLYTTFQWLRRPKLGRPEGVILAAFAFTYGPWLLPLDRPAVFIFYFVAAIPFMCLALGYVAVRIGRSWEAKAAIATFSVIALGFFAFYYPLLTKRPLQSEDWDKRLLFFTDCDKPLGTKTTEVVTEEEGGKMVTSEEIGHENDDIPPEGWCWI
jgi:dolichyl-phosphate-mannose-protein mannosyltransferase